MVFNCDPLLSTSQVAGITSLSHHNWPLLFYLFFTNLNVTCIILSNFILIYLNLSFILSIYLSHKYITGTSSAPSYTSLNFSSVMSHLLFNLLYFKFHRNDKYTYPDLNII
jgi:hypothetical protein